MAFEEQCPKHGGLDPETAEIKQEFSSETEQPKYFAHSIERLVSSSESSKEKSPNSEISQVESKNDNSNGLIKFSVENILKPNFGTQCDIVRRVITPIFKSSDKSRTLVRRSFDNPRILDEEIPKRRHSTGATDPKFSQNPTQAADGDVSSAAKELWPAWVYCTRYSDRPSSGMVPKIFIF